MKAFVIYWLDGHKTLVRGTDITDAFRRAGYGGGVLNAVDFHSDKGDTCYWDRINRRWVERAAAVTICPIKSPRVADELEDQFGELIKTNQAVYYQLPNGDQVGLRYVLGEYYRIGEVQHYEVNYAERVEGPYHPNGKEDHHFMVHMTCYFDPKKTEDAVRAATLMAISMTASKSMNLRTSRLEDIAEAA